MEMEMEMEMGMEILITIWHMMIDTPKRHN